VLNIWQYSFDDGTYSHAYLIPFISMYLYFTLWEDNELVFRDKINVIAVTTLLLCSYLLYVFTIAQFSTGYRIGLILVMASSIAVIFKCSFKVLFPALFLIFLVPVWGSLTITLQGISTLAVTQLMGITGIPVFVEGNLITIPEGVFEIAGGCSGLRYLIVSLAISSLYIFLNIKNYKHASMFLFFAVFGALLTNWIRITLLILVGHYTNMESELMQDHNMFGWYIYIPYMIALFYFGQKLVPNKKEDIQNNVYSSNTNAYITSYPSISFCFIILIVGSTYSKDILINAMQEPMTKDCITPSPGSPQPLIHNFLTSCTSDTSSGQVTNFYFDATNLNNKADFYLNSFHPKGWELFYQEALKTEQISAMRTNNKAYLVTYSFVSENNQTGSPSSHKKTKLINAFKLKSSSLFKWQTRLCVDNCKLELATYKETLR
jgi:exosortase A